MTIRRLCLLLTVLKDALWKDLFTVTIFTDIRRDHDIFFLLLLTDQFIHSIFALRIIRLSCHTPHYTASHRKLMGTSCS